MKDKAPPLYRNGWSYIGFLVVFASVLGLAAALITDLLFEQLNPYVGIFTYLVLPGFLVFGVVLFLFGMRRESRRRRRLKTGEALPYPRVDLNDPVHRRRFMGFLFGGGLLLIVLALAAYKGFHYTESVEFCGQTCHTVMEPEYVTYRNSPHARVRCVDCHVGSGASWYVRSKLSGVRQVFAVLAGSYPRPIPTPIHNLRPARETCEQCHWPTKFFGAQLVQKPYFRHDEANTPEQLSYLLKTGGGDPKLGLSAGIHWHMITGNNVHFVPLDRSVQRVSTIRVERADGSKAEYFREDMMPPAKGALPEHTMDCIDCHNRPSHRFEVPEEALDRALAGGLISRKLPWVKRIAIQALERTYETRAAADREIRAAITGFYEKRYPQVLRTAAAAVESAVQEVTAIYRRNVFPEMKTSWRTHASNIGHKQWRGCFRCHDGKHRTKDGKVLTRDCEICHTMPQRGPLTPLGTTAPNLNQPWHPIELRGRHADLACDRCHAVGVRPNEECRSCHEYKKDAPMMSQMDCSDCHRDTGEAREVAACATCHPRVEGLHKDAKHQGIACKTCHAPHSWTVPERAACLTCHADLADHKAGEGPCAKCHGFRPVAPR
jgi:hypothetical protein